MRDVLTDATFGAVMVATGILVAWFGATWSSPAMGALGAVFAVLGVVAALLHVSPSDEAEESAPVDDATPGITLSSAPECVREDVPPSSKLVWMYLAAEGESTLDDVVSGTQLTQRTTRSAITRLEKSGVLSKRPAERGTGDVYYEVRTPDEAWCGDPGDGSRS